ncbi:MAG TPA: ABC transporter permease [Candidatus Limnocylindrales bacterium]|jgi:osmoprotectant transport system permease protein|nr:ABC transporter permease [Candidatus Limnocylindrales bacterium]
MIDWAWIADHLDDLAGRTVQHLYLAAIAVGVGFVISFGLAIWSIRRRSVYGPIAAVAGILYTIPSLAMFPVLVPVTGLSILTAEIPLVLYTLLIFVRNIVAGFDGVPGEVLEAADGMGYTPSTRLWQVELPLALPLVMAGVRLASVSTIGLVTISGILGDRFGGLGFFIFEGYRRGFPTEIFAGALPSILLAVAVDLALVAAQRRLTPWARPRLETLVPRPAPA